MSNAQGKSRKALVIGVIAAVVVLAALLGVLLTQCNGAGSGETAPSTTGETVVESYDLYWNVDRELYDGKSEAGLSSRTPESDGYFHVRFFKDGEILTLKVSDRKVVNAIDVKDLMGLDIDENGIVVGIIPLDEMPCEQVAWQFYVQSAGGKLIKTNSSESLNGMEVLLECTENTGIWDMTGISGDVGCVATPIPFDRLMAVANGAGEVTHIYLYERSNYMRTHEAECEHCGKVVEWSEWTKTESAPSMTGHYQLMNDIQIPTNGSQISLAEDQKICLDLNGKRIDGRNNSRVYSMHNPGTELAIMDTSEAKTGRIAAHGKGDQGMCVWLRYGVVYLYDGILDASDATSIKNGTAVALQANTYMYMHGGEIIGGTSAYLKQENGKYTNGLGGSVAIANKGKFVLNDGVIRDGKAQSIITKRDAKGQPSTYERGYGGNIFMSSGSVFEMNGGTIKNGTAGNQGGNVYMDGASEFTMKGGVISGGKITAKGRNGGNVFVGGKGIFTMSGGRIENGSSRNCAGNLYLNGKVTMTGGKITGGKIINWNTGKVDPKSASRNVFIVNGNFAMYGGSIDGGVQAIDTDATKTVTRVMLSGYATIEGQNAPNLTISTGGGGVEVRVGTLRDRAKIGVTTTMGLFTLPTAETNRDNFFSDLEGADVVYFQERLGLGRVRCQCGSETDEHIAGCSKELLFWAPWTATDKLPTTTGNYYLTKDVKCGQQNVTETALINLDLNGHRVDGKDNSRIYSMHFRVENVAEDGTKTYEYPAKLTITDTSEGRKGVMASHGEANHQGSIAWLRYGDVVLLAGTFDASDYKAYSNWGAGKDGVFATSDDTTTYISGGAFAVDGGRTLTMYNGTVIGGETIAKELTKTNTIPVPEGAPEGTEPTTEEVTKTVGAGYGGSIAVSGNFYMYGGTVRDGVSGSTGGNIRLSGSSKMYMYGGTIAGGTSTGNGGNLNVGGGSTVLELHGGTIRDGWSKNVSGNIHLDGGTLTMSGGTITGGKSGAAGSTTSENANVFCVNGKMNLTGGTITGHLRVANYNTDGALKGSEVRISGNPVIYGGTVNMVLAPQDDKTGEKDDGKKPTMPIIRVVGPMTEGANIHVNPTTGGIDFAVGEDYSVTAADGKAFTLQATEIKAAADTANNALFFGRYSCLCGKSAHTLGCKSVNDSQLLKWYAWTSKTTLPTTGNYYLAHDVNGSGSTTVKSDTTLNLDLNGNTVTWKYRAYRIYNDKAVANATLTITNTASDNGTIRAAEFTGSDQGCAVWIASGENGVFNLLDGVVLDGSKHTIKNVPSEKNGAGTTTEKNGGVVAVQSGGKFNMYGGTIIGSKAIRSQEITLSNGTKYSSYAPNGAAVAVTGGNANMYDGTITGGDTANQGGNLLISGGKFHMYGGTISGGHAGGSGGNVFVHRSGEFRMSGDARIEGGVSDAHSGNVLVDGKMTMTDNAVVTGGKAGTGAGNINVNYLTSGDKEYSGTLTIDGNATVTDGVSGSHGGNIRVLKGGSATISGNAVISGGIAKGTGNPSEPSGGNINMIDGATVTLSGNAKVIDGQSYHTAGNICISSGATLTIQDNAIVSGGKMTNSKGNLNVTPSENAGSANIFCVDGHLVLKGGTITGNTQVYANGTAGASLTVSGAPVVQTGASGYGIYLSQNKAVPQMYITGALTGEAGSIAFLPSKADKFAVGKDYTLTDADAAVFAATQKGIGVDCAIIREDNNLSLAGPDCLCGLTEHTRACKELWNGEQRMWKPWSSKTSLPTTTGNYYLTVDVDFDYQQKVLANQKVVLDLNGHTVTNDNGQRMYATWESGSSLTITDKTTDKNGKFVASGSAEDQGVLWAYKGNINLIAGTIDATNYELHCVWSDTNKAASPRDGVAVSVSGGRTFNMYGGTVIGGKGVDWTVNVGADGKKTTDGSGTPKDVGDPRGGAVAVSGTFNMYGGTIRDGQTSGAGGNVYIPSGGKMFIYEGATVSGGVATGSSGNILVEGQLTLDGGTIKDGTSGHNGGNIRIGGGTMYMKDGTISGGWGKNVTGNIHVDGNTFIMTGGEIKGGKVGGSASTTTTDANINSVNGKVQLLGGSVDSGILIQNYNKDVANACTTKLGGAMNISGKVVISHSDGKAQPQLEIAPDFTGSLKVYVKTEGIITTNAVTAEQAAKIGTTNSGKGVYQITDNMGFPAEDVGKLYVGQIHCVCGASKNGGNHYSDICDGTMHVWQPTTTIVDSDGKGADQYYYFTADVTASNTQLWGSEHNVTYDMNGFNLKNTGGRVLTTYSSSGDCKLPMTFTIVNTGSTGSIKVSGAGDEGRIAWLRGSQKKVNLYNVTIDISGATHKSSHTVEKNGIAVAVNGWSNTANLYKVTATGGTSASNGNFLGTSGYNNKATVKDSKVTGCSTAQTEKEFGGNGGAFFVGDQATLTLHNTEVTGNIAKHNGGGVYVLTKGKLIISGSTKITGNTVNGVQNNVYLEEGAILETGTLGSDAQVGLTGITEKVLSTDVTFAEKTAFTSDSKDYQVVRMADGLSLQPASAHIHCVCGGTIKTGTKLADGTTHNCVDILYTPMSMTAGNIGGNRNWYLENDLTTLTGQLTTQNYVLNLCLNGKNMTTSANARMIRTYCSNASTTDDNRIVLTSCQKDTIVDGKATNNRIYQKNRVGDNDSDGGIFWITSSGTLEMYAGNLDASMYTLKPNADDIAKHGCAVLVEGGNTFKLYGGTIIGGKTLKGVNNNSEGACIFSGGTFIMTGGTIIGGETVGSGGSLFLNTNSVTKIYGGTITGGKATNNGGNIYYGGKELLLKGGTIEKGTAGSRGGNIMISANGATISGGTIQSGYAKDAGNVCLGTNITAKLSGGTIKEGKATSCGGNMYLMGTLEMTNGMVTNGYYMENKNGTLEENKNQVGANVNMNNTGVLKMSGGQITGRTTSVLAGAKVELSGTAKLWDTDTSNNLRAVNMTVTIGELTGDARVGFLIMKESEIAQIATIKDGVTVDPTRFPIHDLSLTNYKTRSFTVEQQGTSLKIVEKTN